MKKMLVLVLALLIALPLGGIGSAEETLSLSVLGRQRSGITFEEVQTIHAWEVLCDMFAANNVELSYTVVERDQYATVLNATIASGDIPDFFYAASLSDADCINLVEAGLLMDISDALAYSNGAASSEFAEGGLYEISRQMHTYTDGGMYFFGNVSKQISVETEPFGPHAIVGNNCAMLIRQDWLDKLGLPMPTTADELLEVLIAFRENDVNGNGQADERICLDIDYFFNGATQWFGLAPFMFQMNRETGEAVNPFMQEGFVPYIEFLKACVDAGVLHLGDEVAYFNGGTAEGDSLGIAMQEDSVAAYFGVALADHGVQPAHAQYTLLPLLTGVEGVDPVMNASVGYKVWSRWAFSAKADPRAVAAFLDTICTQEYAKWVTFGVEDETYTVDPESGMYTFTASNVVADILETKIARGYPLVIDSFLPDASQIGWYQEYYGPLNWDSYDDFMNSAYFETLVDSYPAHQIENLREYCRQSASAPLYNFNQDIGMITPMNTLEEAEVLDFYDKDYETFWRELLAGYLTGQYNIADYEAHVEELRAMGADDVQAVRQAQYDRLNSN